MAKQQALLDVAPELEQKVEQDEKPNRLGYDFREMTSALQKEIRAGDFETAVYWGLQLYSKAPDYVWKRMLIIAAEDIGFADVEAVQLVNSLAAGYRATSLKVTYAVSPHSLVMAIVALSRAEKSVFIDDLLCFTRDRLKRKEKLPILDRYLCQHTPRGRAMGRGDPHWYADRHVTCEIPVNEYTMKLYGLHPEWFPPDFTKQIGPEENPVFALDAKRSFHRSIEPIEDDEKRSPADSEVLG